MRKESDPDIFKTTHLAILAVATLLFASGCSKPDWEKPDRPLWAYVASNNADDGNFRFFINTKATRKDADKQTVKVLMRIQRIAAGEEEKADVPKDDEQTSVQNFTCDRNRKGYDISATLRMYVGKQWPQEIPPDSELPIGVAAKDLWQFGDWNPLGRVRKAACFLAGYK